MQWSHENRYLCAWRVLGNSGMSMAAASMSKISLVGGLFVARVHWTLKVVLEKLYRWKLWETDLVRQKTKSVTPIYVVKYVR